MHRTTGSVGTLDVNADTVVLYLPVPRAASSRCGTCHPEFAVCDTVRAYVTAEPISRGH